jgi:hypothetical protein
MKFSNKGLIVVLIPEMIRPKSFSEHAVTLPAYQVVFKVEDSVEIQDNAYKWLSYRGKLDLSQPNEKFRIMASAVQWSDSPPEEFRIVAKDGPMISGFGLVVDLAPLVVAIDGEERTVSVEYKFD